MLGRGCAWKPDDLEVWVRSSVGAGPRLNENPGRVGPQKRQQREAGDSVCEGDCSTAPGDQLGVEVPRREGGGSCSE